MINKFTIYGERCSGTNYLENLIKKNFDVEITWKFGWKHFFGFQNESLKNSDNTLFICIVRDLKKWINSLYKEKWHIAKQTTDSVYSFLNKQFYSHNYTTDRWEHQKSFVYGVTKTNSEIIEDRNIYTKKRYRSIFELRHTKIKFMIEDLPNKVKNYIFIKYEDLLNNFNNIMIKIKNKGLNIKKNIQFPLNIHTYKNEEKSFENNKNKKKLISDKLILTNPNLIPYYEKKLGYIR